MAAAAPGTVVAVGSDAQESSRTNVASILTTMYNNVKENAAASLGQVTGCRTDEGSCSFPVYPAGRMPLK